MIKPAVLCLSVLAAALAACSSPPSGEDVVEQARPGGRVSFDVVKIDEGVIDTLQAQQPPPFAERFKKFQPPPDLKIAVGDVVSVVIWESAANGLFGNSLTELAFPAGAAARLLTGQAPSRGTRLARPGGVTTATDTLSQLLGLSTAANPALAAPSEMTPGLGTAAGLAAVLAPPTGAVAAAAEAAGGGRGATSGAAAPGEAAAQEAAAVGAVRAQAAGGVAGLRSPPGLGGQTGEARPDAERRAGAAQPSQSLERLAEVAAQTGRPGTLIPLQQVGPDGAISIPYAGRVVVAGQTPNEVEHRIEQLLAGKALDPQALVMVKFSFANSVSVEGEAINGARVPLSPGGDRLLEVLAAAGGAKGPVHDAFVRLSRDGVTATVPLATLVADPAQNIYAAPGDVVTVVRQPKTFSVFGATGAGAVGTNSRISFAGERLSLTEALAKSGGLLDQRADPRSVFLFRHEPVELVRALGQPLATGAPDGLSPVVYRLDLSEAKSYLLAKRFPVHDKDIIFVANARAVPVMHFFQALSKVAGPVVTGLVVCQTSNSC